MLGPMTWPRLLGTDNERLSKIDRSEDEHPDVLLAIYADGRMHQIARDLAQMELQTQSFRPNILSSVHVPWAGIDLVSEATKKPPTMDVYAGSSTLGELESTKYCPILRKRRSAQRMDGQTVMPLESFHAILEATLPGRIPFGLLPWRPHVHPVIFVHRVEGLDRGLYVLLRDVSQKERLQAAMLDDFVWKKPSRTPEDLGFYLLAQGDGRMAIKEASCRQDIASDGCFAAALIAEFMEPLQKYRTLVLFATILGVRIDRSGILSRQRKCRFPGLWHWLLLRRHSTPHARPFRIKVPGSVSLYDRKSPA